MKANSIIGLIAIIVIVTSCVYYRNHEFRQTYNTVNEAIHIDTSQTRYLKAHYKTGEVAIFSKWSYNNQKDSIVGEGKLFDFRRSLLKRGKISTAVKDLSIFETNKKDFISSKDSEMATAIGVMTAVNVAFTAFCIINPKACFGSCPTFYINPDQSLHYADAEGFSSAVIPSLKYGDIDDLNHQSRGGPFKLYMKNEALETHMIDEVKLKAVKLNEDQLAFHSNNDKFYVCQEIRQAKNISGNKKVKLELINAIDDKEYYSFTDSTNLMAKEELVINFDKGKDDTRQALLLNFRQSLVATYLFYNALSLAGDEATDMIAKLESSAASRSKMDKVFRSLGSIEVSVWKDQSESWKKVGQISETGPIARNKQILILPEWVSDEHELRIKLRMSKGAWKLDHIAVASVVDEVIPETYRVKVLKNQSNSINNLSDNLLFTDSDYLITLPGESYEMVFDISDPNQNYQLFLFSSGYYLEWLRQEWLEDKDVERLLKMIEFDKQTWKELAQEYKGLEENMEKQFWSSKIEYLQ